MADITWLDNLGIPAYEAVRPNSRSAAVHHGKGLTPLLAKVSAAMEALEYFCAETVSVATVQFPVSEMEQHLQYDPYDLPRPHPNLITDETVLEWVRAEILFAEGQTYLPKSFVELNAIIPDSLPVPRFVASSNGLATGNSLVEAIVHALYEVIERECIAALSDCRQASWIHVDPSALGTESAKLFEKYAKAGNQVEIIEASHALGVPCFYVRTRSPTLPLWVQGAGCHLDAEIALCRALTEAALGRAWLISGARDDLSFSVGQLTAMHNVAEDSLEASPTLVRPDTRSTASPSLAEDLDRLVSRIHDFTGNYPMVVDLTQPFLGVAAVKVVAVGLRDPRVNVP